MMSLDTLGPLLLVDRHDQWIGLAEKLETHQKGLLHRAFSVFVWRAGKEGREILLQRRALGKYHSPGLWSNTCCGHPSLDPSTSQPMDTLQAASKRLQEEMHIQLPLDAFVRCGVLTYKKKVSHDLEEHEIDYILAAQYEESLYGPVPPFNPEEAMDIQWITVPTLYQELETHPEKFTVWLKDVLDIFVAHP